MTNRSVRHFIQDAHITNSQSSLSEDSDVYTWLHAFKEQCNKGVLCYRNIFKNIKYHSPQKRNNILEDVKCYICQRYELSRQTLESYLTFLDNQEIRLIHPHQSGKYSFLWLLAHKNKAPHIPINIENPQLASPRIVAYIFSELLGYTISENPNDIARALIDAYEHQHPCFYILANITRMPLPIWFYDYSFKHLPNNPFVNENIILDKSPPVHWNGHLIHFNLLDNQLDMDREYYFSSLVFLQCKQQTSTLKNTTDAISTAILLYHQHLITDHQLYLYCQDCTLAQLLTQNIDGTIQNVIQWDPTYAILAEVNPDMKLSEIQKFNPHDEIPLHL